MSCRLWCAEGPLGAAQGHAWLVVELLKERGHWLLLLSTRAPGSSTQQALAAFGTRAARIDRLRQLGFLGVETPIDVTVDGGRLCVAVQSPLSTGAPETWLRVHGVALQAPGVPVAVARQVVRQQQRLASPAPEAPIDRLVLRELTFDTTRRDLRPLPPARLQVCGLGPVALGPWAGLELPLPQARCGRIDLPPAWLPVQGGPGPDPVAPTLGAVRRVPRQPLLPATGYRFTDVEILGFRIDLGDRDGADQVLQDMVEPLNFHRAAEGRGQGWGAQAFRWRAAARVVTIELLRYGRMYWGEAPPQPGQPFTAQHELLLRVLVGRVDDDSAQARDPALFVPAIFVDNAWSRGVGRELQGFDKRPARFATAAGVLDMTGRLPGHGQPEPLLAVNRVLQASGRGAELLQLVLPPGADDPTLWADVRLLMGHGGGWRGTRWRQGDFVHPLFRRGFAGRALGSDPAQMASVQAAPVDGRPLPSAWVRSTMVFDRMLGAMPDGVARLRLSPEHGPPAWRSLAALFPEGEIALTGGAWYRARADMHLRPERGC